MILYDKKPQYNSDTGQVNGFIYKESGLVLCDYCGTILISDGSGRSPDYEVQIAQIGGCEQTWYYDNVDWLLELIKQQYPNDCWHEDAYGTRNGLFGGAYHFSNDLNVGCDASLFLMKEMVSGFEDKDSIFYQCSSLDDGLRRSRARIVKAGLQTGKITLDQLGILEP